MLSKVVGLQSQKSARKTTFFTPPIPIPTKREDWEGDCRLLASETQNMIKGPWLNKHCISRFCPCQTGMHGFARSRLAMLSCNHFYADRRRESIIKLPANS
jgi:hypothetical protein